MGYYDVFALFYDSSVAKHYISQRVASQEALDLAPGLTVLDCPAGTGLSFPHIRAGIGDGLLIGADISSGMLAKAGKKSAAAGWGDTVRLVTGDAATLSASDLGVEGVDRLHIFLGMTAFPDMAGTFTKLWGLLKPGGRCVIVDVHAETLGFQGRMVNLTARADITRRFWEPLEAVAEGYSRTDLESTPAHGGTMMLAMGTKPG
jgi:ubiquinone/menaquinone biosynthesis C-methylase UbiE